MAPIIAAGITLGFARLKLIICRNGFIQAGDQTTMSSRYVAYYRVSTKRQGESGLGLDAQRDAVRRFVSGGELVAEFEEVESGKRHDRPALEAALRECRLRGAILVIAKLDRLARSVAFLSKLMEEGVDFRAVDMPEANRLMVHVMAAMAEHEREMISLRTKAALKVARDRGANLGGRRGDHRIEDHGEAGRRRSAEVRSRRSAERAAEIRSVIAELQSAGVATLAGLADALNQRSIPTPRGGRWCAGQVRRVVGQYRVRAIDASARTATDGQLVEGLSQAHKSSLAAV